MQAPFFDLTPETGTSVEVEFRPPREANLLLRCQRREQAACQEAKECAGGRKALITEELIESARVRGRLGRIAIYKISQMARGIPMYFGSIREKEG